MPEPIQNLVEQFAADRRSLSDIYPTRFSPAHRKRMAALVEEWRRQLETKTPETTADKFDLLLLKRKLNLDADFYATEPPEQRILDSILPFATTILELHEAWLRKEFIQPQQAAETIGALAQQITTLKLNDSPEDAAQAAELLTTLTKALDDWHAFYNAYDPAFTWWTAKPFEQLKNALTDYEANLKEQAKAGFEGFQGHPVGQERLLKDLKDELIPYAPDELIAMSETELAWCQQELQKATKELGFENWRDAQNFVKQKHADPGGQIHAVRALALEAIDYLESNNLLTIPALAKETWRMAMMSPERQKINPFFLGGDTIVVSFPTDAMTHGEKLMSMRGNNTPFSRATVQHELIPGHHMQQFMCARHRPYRRIFYTPFWIEGWALYWEMRLWDLGFPRTAEEKIGMLFWRIHRCARVVFSLKFHLGEMSASECVEMLVDQVGHERATAEGEVRRSFNGSYPPLYQLAYLIGGFQFRALHRELVQEGPLTDREFHDAVLKENDIPVTVLREILWNREPDPNGVAPWKFAG